MATTKKVKLVYESGFATTQLQLLEPRLKKVLDVIKGISPHTINKLLDIGCGDGFIAEEIAKITNAKLVYGIDISKAAIQIASLKKIKGYCLDIDEVDMPFKANYFDFIYCGSLIELVADADHLLIEMHRTLKKGGIAVITFPNITSWLSRVAILFGYLPFYYRVSTKFDLGKMFSPITRGNSTGFIRLFNISSFTLLAQQYGLHTIKIIGATDQHLPGYLQHVDRLISKRPTFASQVICILSKR